MPAKKQISQKNLEKKVTIAISLAILIVVCIIIIICIGGYLGWVLLSL